MIATALDNVQLGACTQDPDRWTTGPDNEAKALCRACPRRWLCARDVVASPGAEGLWAGVVIPEAGRARVRPAPTALFGRAQRIPRPRDRKIGLVPLGSDRCFEGSATERQREPLHGCIFAAHSPIAEPAGTIDSARN
jgi:WhiB family transcriptional regulator, redox-sensing transcriptional regulator